MKKMILVTGSHRSGTTWTGKVIASAHKIRYVYEPFNIALKRKNCPLKYWFAYAETSIAHQKEIANYLKSFYKFWHVNNITRLNSIKSFQDLHKYAGNMKGRLDARTLIKDPLALFSAEWMYHHFNLCCVVLIRHPAAFVASLKVANWQFDFNNFLNQPYLLQNYLKEYQTEITDFAENKRGIIDQGILLWNCIYSTINYYQKTYKKDWYFIKHEALSLHPLQEFHKLFLALNIPFTNGVKSYIKKTTNSEIKTDLERNTLKNIYSWKTRLTPEEITRIKIGTESVWQEFYSESDW